MQQSLTFTMKSQDGVDLFVDHFETKLARSSKKPNRILFIVHGYGEHSSRYKHVQEFLSEHFDEIYAMDLRGHGRSGGIRGHTPSFNLIVEDIKIVFEEVKRREFDSRYFLLCHSFGGLAGLSLLYKEKNIGFEAAVISSPLLQVAMPISPIIKSVASMLNKTFSRLQLWSEINPAHVSHDPLAIEAYIKDKLVHSKITPRMFFEMQTAMEWIRSKTDALPCPTLFLVAGQDKIVSAQAIRDFYKNLKDPKKEIREYPEMYHEVLNEIYKAKVFKDISDWLKRHNI